MFCTNEPIGRPIEVTHREMQICLDNGVIAITDSVRMMIIAIRPNCTCEVRYYDKSKSCHRDDCCYDVKLCPINTDEDDDSGDFVLFDGTFDDDCDEDFSDEEGDLIKNIYINGKHTTVEFFDGSKTTVGCMDGEPYNEYAGFCAAITKSIFGTTKNAIDTFNKKKIVTTKKPNKAKGADAK